MLSKIGIFGKLLVEFRLWRRHLVVGERNAIEETDHALGHRPQIVLHLGPEGDDDARSRASALILTFPVVLEQQLAVLADQQRMQVVHLATLFGLGKTAQEFVRRRRVDRLLCGDGEGRDGRQGSPQAHQQMAAVEAGHNFFSGGVMHACRSESSQNLRAPKSNTVRATR